MPDQVRLDGVRLSNCQVNILLALCVSGNIRGRIQYVEGKENTRKKLGDI